MPAPMPVGGLTMASFALTAAVVGNAYYQKRQFYPSVVYITKSNPSMAAIYFLAFTLVILVGKFLKKVFFGQLRAAEFERLIEKSFYAVTETCLAFTVFRDDFSPKFVALFTVLLFLKAFHWLADSRVDYMERSPVITVLFHIRVSSLLILLSLLDLVLVNHAYHSTVTRGASVQLVFGFEYAILFTIAFNIGVKYVCHTIDLQSENPWENKAGYLLYTDLFVGLVKVILYGLFMFIMIRIHTFPLFIIRPMYLTIRSFKKTLNDAIQSRRAIRNMNTLYPDATSEELSAVDNVCIICREEMLTGAKKLPCGHIFHSSCLRSWFQRQQTCPTCRMDILRQPVPPAAQAPLNHPQQPQQQVQPEGQMQPQQNQQQQQQQQQQPQNLPNPFAGLFAPGAAGVVPPPFPFLPQFGQGAAQQPPQQPEQQQPVSTTAAAAATSSVTTSVSSTSLPSSSSTSTCPSGTSPQAAKLGTAASSTGTPFPAPMGFIPPFMPFMPYAVPPPQPPNNFAGMTLEELQQMEGRERSHVEARIRALQNIQTLLDAAVVQMNQYAAIVSSLDVQSQHSSRSPSARPTANPMRSSSVWQPQENDSGAEKQQVPEDRDKAGSEYLMQTNGASAVPSTSHAATLQSSIGASLPDKPASADGVPVVPSDASTVSNPEDPQEMRRRRLERFSNHGGATGSS